MSIIGILENYWFPYANVVFPHANIACVGSRPHICHLVTVNVGAAPNSSDLLRGDGGKTVWREACTRISSSFSRHAFLSLAAKCPSTHYSPAPLSPCTPQPHPPIIHSSPVYFPLLSSFPGMLTLWWLGEFFLHLPSQKSFQIWS